VPGCLRHSSILNIPPLRKLLPTCALLVSPHERDANGTPILIGTFPRQRLGPNQICSDGCLFDSTSSCSARMEVLAALTAMALLRISVTPSCFPRR